MKTINRVKKIKPKFSTCIKYYILNKVKNPREQQLEDQKEEDRIKIFKWY